MEHKSLKGDLHISDELQSSNAFKTHIDSMETFETLAHRCTDRVFSKAAVIKVVVQRFERKVS
jgi:hypothetical protein